MAPTPFSTIADSLLAECVTALGSQAPGPDHRYISHGKPAWDLCREPQLAVYVAAIGHRQSRGNQGRHTQVQPRARYTIELVQCVPNLKKNRKPATAAAFNASALELLDEYDAIEKRITSRATDIFGLHPDVQWGDALPLGPLGDIAGWSWPITAGRV